MTLRDPDVFPAAELRHGSLRKTWGWYQEQPQYRPTPAASHALSTRVSDSSLTWISLLPPPPLCCAQLYPTLCDPMDCSTPCSSVHGICQARILEWVAISYSRVIFPTQASNPHFLSLMHGQADSLPTKSPGKPFMHIHIFLFYLHSSPTIKCLLLIF